ncbi:MAG TPA: histidine kinase [Cyclobacteriaceae bacterium]|nr:histidine kinase [Cyclobacteriaceae bacterium]
MFFISNSDFEERVSLKAAEFCEQITAEMGAELHDDLIQKLYTLSLCIEHVERTANDPAGILALTARMRSDFESATQSVRAIARRLNPVHKGATTVADNISHLCQTMERPGYGHVLCTSTGRERPISELIYLHLYRIVQELIHNAFKHSSAWNVAVLISWNPGMLTIQVEDDGTSHVSIETITTTLRDKRNTLNMRSQTINASITFTKGKKGLLVSVECPIK